MIGPDVLMVRVEEADPLALTTTGFGLKVQMGGIVTSGVTELHASVMPGVPEGVVYPLIGLTVIIPWPPLPAGTDVGETARVTVMVNCGDTARTVRPCGAVVVVCPMEDAVPVTVTE